MPRIHSEFVVNAPLKRVAQFHGSTDALPVLTPPPVIVRIAEGGEVHEDKVAKFTLWMGPFPIEWHALHTDVGPGGFVDTQVKGPLRSWQHTHRFIPVSATETRVVDTVEYDHHRGMQGLMTRALFAQSALKLLFVFRAYKTRAACATPLIAREAGTPAQTVSTRS